MMLLVVEIIMLLTGLHALVTGRFKLREDRVIYGVPARLIGLFCMLPIPLAFCGGFVLGVIMAVQGQDPLDPSVRVIVKAIDTGSLVLSMLLVAFTISIAAPWARRPGQCHDRQGDLIRSSLPAWTDHNSAPADAIRGNVPLRTMALAGYGTPRPAEVPTPEPAKRGVGVPAWIGTVVLLAIVVNNAVRHPPPTVQSSPANATPAGGAPFAGAPVGGPPQAGKAIDPPKEVADRLDQVPTKVDPLLLNAGAKVYLSDLQEFAWAGPADWSFGNAGRLGDRGQPRALIRYGKESTAKSLSMHPPHTGYARVCYFLDRRAQSLSAKVCFSDHDKRTRPKTTRFVVLGDGKVVWQTPPLAEHGVTYLGILDVSQVSVLELRTYVETGDSTGSHAVWLEPYVNVKTPTNYRPPR